MTYFEEFDGVICGRSLCWNDHPVSQRINWERLAT